jgi:hypothetical protein
MDSAANIDPTKLKRAAFIGAASGYFLANFSARDVESSQRAIRAGALARATLALARQSASRPIEDYERSARASVGAFAGAPVAATRRPAGARKGDGSLVFRRASTPKGPLMVFGYDYFADHARPAGVETPKLIGFEGEWGGGEEYAYEALNLADGTRSVEQIAEVLSVEYGAVPLDLVVEYLQALKKIGVVN